MGLHAQGVGRMGPFGPHPNPVSSATWHSGMGVLDEAVQAAGLRDDIRALL